MRDPQADCRDGVTWTNTLPYSYLRARYYDPGLGRFASRDTVFGVGTHPMSLNQHAYSLDNPTTLADPSGRWTVGICLGGDFNVLLGVGAEAQLCVVAVLSIDHPQVGVLRTLGVGGIWGPELSGSLVAQVSNADDLGDLEGGFGSGGIGGELGGGVVATGFGGFSPRCRQPIGGGAFGPSIGAGFSARATYTDTAILGQIGAPEQSCASKSQALR